MDARYRWSNGSTASGIEVDRAGQVTVRVQMEGCAFFDTIAVIDAEAQVEFPKDTVICRGDLWTLRAPAAGAYRWSTGETSPVIQVSEPGEYGLVVSNKCETRRYSTRLTVEDCDCKVFVPNVFSPHSIGANNRMEVMFNCDLPYRLIRFSIFDRWGSLIYQTDAADGLFWDGSLGGRALSSGVYLWQLLYEVENKGVTQTVVKTGDISIVK
jgi:gliding motility-associated-like protein